MGDDFPIKIIKENKTNKEVIHPKNSIVEQMSCPFCKKIFKSSATIKEFNIHIKRCGVLFIQINKECELFPPSQDYELNNFIYIYSEQYKVNYYNKTQDTFDQKIEKLKNSKSTLDSLKLSANLCLTSKNNAEILHNYICLACAKASNEGRDKQQIQYLFKANDVAEKIAKKYEIFFEKITSKISELENLLKNPRILKRNTISRKKRGLKSIPI